MARITRYPAALRHLHWLIAILMMLAMGAILGRFFLTQFLIPAPDSFLADLSNPLFLVHQTAGFFVLVFSVIRIAFSFVLRKQKPESFNAPFSPPWFAEKIVHFFLQYAVIALVLFGWLTVNAYDFSFKLFGLFEMPRLTNAIDLSANPSFFFELLMQQSAHAILGFALIIFTGMHIGAVIMHQFIKRDPAIQRML